MKGRLAAGLAVVALLLGGVMANEPVKTAPSVPVAAVQASGTTSLASAFPPAWQVRLHQFSWFSMPPSTYDFNLLNYMVPESGNTMTYCINIGGNWNNITQAITMNAPGVLHVFPFWGCEAGSGSGNEVTRPICLSSTNCFQQKSCDFQSMTPPFRYGDWQNVSGTGNCTVADGQPSSLRWRRWS